MSVLDVGQLTGETSCERPQIVCSSYLRGIILSLTLWWRLTKLKRPTLWWQQTIENTRSFRNKNKLLVSLTSFKRWKGQGRRRVLMRGASWFSWTIIIMRPNRYSCRHQHLFYVSVDKKILIVKSQVGPEKRDSIFCDGIWIVFFFYNWVHRDVTRILFRGRN